jgi:hypothetical protein
LGPNNRALKGKIMRKSILRITAMLVVFAIFLPAVSPAANAAEKIEPWVTVPPVGPPSENCMQFENGHYICDEFLAAWHGSGLDMSDEGISYRESLALFGLPLTQVFVYEGQTIQVWERFVAELHPGNSWSPVLFRLLGNELASTLPQEFVDAVVPDNTCFGTYYPETQKCLQDEFKTFWELNGGLLVFGYPKNDGNADLTTSDGTYRSQLFERQLMEIHPENAGTPYEILLARLGAWWLEMMEGNSCPEVITSTPILVPADCLIIGDVQLSDSENGSYEPYYDDDGDTGLLVIVITDVYAKTDPAWKATSLHGITRPEVELQDSILKSAGGCGLTGGCTSVTIEHWPRQ